MFVVKPLCSITTADYRIRDQQYGYKQINETNFDKIALIMGTFKTVRSGCIDYVLKSYKARSTSKIPVFKIC